ncbi:MAG: hypothetical protein WCY19_00065 [Candidatus Gastranaerophilaceae bacterium]
MTYQHKEMAAGRWENMPFCEQMANVGSEVERALNWRDKDNLLYSQKALDRALELLDLTIDCVEKKSYLKELTRIREALLDFFVGENFYKWNKESIKKFFYYFGLNARREQSK